MSTYLLTWNPTSWPWDDINETAQKVAKGIPIEERWSCGNARKIPIGSRVFLLRQGQEPKGIVASGWVTKSTFKDSHWSNSRASAGEEAYFIKFTPDVLLTPEIGPPLDLRGEKTPPLSKVQLNAPASGNSIPEDAAIALEAAWEKHLGPYEKSLGEGDPELALVEGKIKQRFVNHRTRERALRNAKLEQVKKSALDGRLRCEVPGCNFDFQDIYGSAGEGFAHVHHLRPLAEMTSSSKTTLQDLAVVCANCHAIIHRGGECRPIETLISLKKEPSPPNL